MPADPASTDRASHGYARNSAPLLGVLLLAVTYATVATVGPDARGFWQDDGIYLATAQSLAEGMGYRHIESPGKPYQTKYPILFPAVLAVSLRLWPDPRVAAIPGALFAAGFALGGALYLRRVLELPRMISVLTALLAAASPSIVSLVRFSLSDLTYAALSVLALACVDGPARTEETASRRRRWLVAGSLLVAAAMLTRGVGASLAVALVATLALRRLWIEAACAAGTIAVAMTPWWIWQAWAARQNGALARALLLAPDLAYGTWRPEGFPEMARAVVQNLVRAGFGIGRYEFALPEGIFLGAMSGSLGRALIAHAAAILSLGLVVVGVLASARRGFRTVHVYLAAYAVLVLVWPFEPFRFLVALTPLLIGFALLGVWSAASSSVRLARLRPIAVIAAAAGLAFLFLAEDARIVRSTKAAFRVAGRTTTALLEDDAASAFIREHVGTEEVIASVLPARVFLRTGRPGVCVWHDAKAYRLYAGPERSWRRFYLDGDTNAFLESEFAVDLVRAYREAGVRYVLLANELAPAALVRFVRARPDLFERRWRSPGGTQEIYAFSPALAAEGS